MKKILVFFFALFTALTMGAQSRLLEPEFSLDSAPKWYNVQFKSGEAYLRDRGVGQNMVTVAVSNGLSSQFMFVGKRDAFKMKSKRGNWVTFKNGAFATTQDETQASNLVLEVNQNSGFSEIRQSTSSGCMNQNGGGGAGRELCEYTKGDGGNQLTFAQVPAEPFIVENLEFSEEDEPVWLGINFTRGGQIYLSDKGAGTPMRTVGEVVSKNEKFQVIGDIETFQIKCMTGNWLCYKGSRFCTTPNKSEAQKFTIAKAKGGANYELFRLESSQAMNQSGGFDAGRELSEYSYGDPNNTMRFVNVSSLNLDFSTEELPVWYGVRFNGGGAYLSDESDGGLMKTVENISGQGQKFQMIGKENSFKMKSQTNRWVTFDAKSSRFKTSSKAGDAVDLSIITGSVAGCFEIIRTTSDRPMNQVGGTGTGRELGEWNRGDGNNQLNFVSLTPRYPLFSNEDNSVEKYYYLKFLVSKNVLTEVNEKYVRTNPLKEKDNQLWKLVGTKDNFQLVSKSGKYASIGTETIGTATGGNNGHPLMLSDAQQNGGFKLVVSDRRAQGLAFEIVATNESGNNHLNVWGSNDNNNTIGLWQANDPNNVMTFVAPNEVLHADYVSTGSATHKPSNDLTLWYKEPATTAKLFTPDNWYSNWMEYALPIGDGQFGASLFGGIAKDEILFNEKTVWSGTSKDFGSYGKYEVFGSLFAENLGDDFDYTAEKGATDYFRELDLTNATGRVSFKNKAGVTFTREYIASNPARVVVAHYTADQDGKINLRFSMKSGKPGIQAKTTYENGQGVFSGHLQTIHYNARFKVVKRGGSIETTSQGIEVRNADEVMVVLAGGTDYDPYSDSYIKDTESLATNIQTRVDEAAETSWSVLYDKHVEDYRKFFSRVDFQLVGTDNSIPTNELIDTYDNGNGSNALMLEKLYFAYGRYLEISSSRGVHLPSNLQGIWNNNANPAWNADIHSNINVQMNYWPAEPTNLSEMHEPFLYYIWNMAENHPQWKAYAKDKAKQPRGWTCFTENNIFGGSGTFATNYVIANAWYVTHLWQHYRYTLDYKFLKKVFPAMLSASQFWMDRVILDKSDNTYVAPNEFSPEHGPSEDGVAHAQQLIYELFDNTLEAIKVLGKDAHITPEDQQKLEERFHALDPGLRTEKYKGNWGASIPEGAELLKEWKKSPYDVNKAENGHRHMSHLMCLYPFSQINPDTKLFKAAINSMTLRGDGATGWSMGWKINLWARALDGNHAHKILNNALRHANAGSGVYYNLFDAHNPFQIDGNFGACAGMAEMIMQSNADTIRILPALPDAWAAGGYMNGLKAVKDFTVSVSWKDKAATRFTIVNNKGQEIPVLYKDLAKATVYMNGVPSSDLAVDEKGVALLKGVPGTVYEFVFDDSPSLIGGKFSIGKAGYSTYYTDKAFIMPADAKAAIITSRNDNQLLADYIYTEGSIVPAKTALLLKGANKTYYYQVVESKEEAPASNYLHGTLDEQGYTSVPGAKAYYKLSYNSKGQDLGFYWGAPEGAAFKSAIGKAYLALSNEQAVNLATNGFSLDSLEEMTGIDQVDADGMKVWNVYDLNGRRIYVNALQDLSEGIYIVNGKKVIIK